MRNGTDRTVTVLRMVIGSPSFVRVMTTSGEREVSEDHLRNYFELVHNEPCRTAWERLLEDEP